MELPQVEQWWQSLSDADKQRIQMAAIIQYPRNVHEAYSFADYALTVYRDLMPSADSKAHINDVVMALRRAYTGLEA